MQVKLSYGHFRSLTTLLCLYWSCAKQVTFVGKWGFRIRRNDNFGPWWNAPAASGILSGPFFGEPRMSAIPGPGLD
jgi:hypothetical protein